MTRIRLIGLVGALFALAMTYPGYKLLRAKPEYIGTEPQVDPSGGLTSLGGRSITPGNSKVILFYMGLLSSSVALEKPDLADVIIVDLTVAGVLGSVMSAYNYGAARVGRKIRNDQNQTRINRTADSVMGCYDCCTAG